MSIFTNLFLPVEPCVAGQGFELWKANADGFTGGQNQQHNATTSANCDHRYVVLGSRGSIRLQFMPNLMPTRSTVDPSTPICTYAWPEAVELRWAALESHANGATLPSTSASAAGSVTRRRRRPAWHHSSIPFMKRIASTTYGYHSTQTPHEIQKAKTSTTI